MAQLNKPKFSLFQNAYYALDGLKEVFENETSFKVDVTLFVLFGVIIYFLPLEAVYRWAMFLAMFIVILAELINSSIERVVDLVTQEHHELAKHAKDAGSAIVFVSFVSTFLIWVAILLRAFKII